MKHAESASECSDEEAFDEGVILARSHVGSLSRWTINSRESRRSSIESGRGVFSILNGRRVFLPFLLALTTREWQRSPSGIEKKEVQSGDERRSPLSVERLFSLFLSLFSLGHGGPLLSINEERQCRPGWTEWKGRGEGKCPCRFESRVLERELDSRRHNGRDRTHRLDDDW